MTELIYDITWYGERQLQEWIDGHILRLEAYCTVHTLTPILWELKTIKILLHTTCSATDCKQESVCRRWHDSFRCGFTLTLVFRSMIHWPNEHNINDNYLFTSMYHTFFQTQNLFKILTLQFSSNSTRDFFRKIVRTNWKWLICFIFGFIVR